MKPFYGKVHGKNPRYARAPHRQHQAVHARGKHKPRQFHGSLDACPPEIRDCISEMRGKATVEKWEPSHVARQLWFTVKKKLIDLGRYVQMELQPTWCQAKSRYIFFKFLLGHRCHTVRLELKEIEAL